LLKDALTVNRNCYLQVEKE